MHQYSSHAAFRAVLKYLFIDFFKQHLEFTNRELKHYFAIYHFPYAFQQHWVIINSTHFLINSAVAVSIHQG